MEQFSYDTAVQYWSAVDPSVDGMLGGFAELSQIDVNDSKVFLKSLQSLNVGWDCALDCGAGIGRVTKQVLLPMFKTVDMVDAVHELVQASAEYLCETDSTRIGAKFVCGLHNFKPEKDRYDVIWMQFCSGYLTDDDLVAFLKRCKASPK